MIDLSELNDNQREAVEWDDGPLLVLAGPGSGKTRVMTWRIARIIEATPKRHFRILGLTFTNNAASEMQERIASLVPNAGDRVLLTTFHAFSSKLVSQHGSHIGLKPNFTILNQDADRQLLLDDAISRAGVNQKDQSSERLLPLVTQLIESDISPDKSHKALSNGNFTDPELLATVYGNYRELMIENNCLDFPGLVAEALGLLRSHKGVRKLTQTAYPYICVDEFQDTNRSQYEMLRYLVNHETRNLFVVADDNQIIYQWNGASTKRLQDLKNDFQTEIQQLPENYRCPPEVINLANQLIVNNPDRMAERSVLQPYGRKKGSHAVNLHRFNDFTEESQWVAQSIAEKNPEQRTHCVVLSRTRKLLDQVVKSLGEQGIDGYIATRKMEFESAPLQWLHSILRLANSRNSRDQLRRICRAFYQLEGVNIDMDEVVSHASAEDSDYLRSWAAIALQRNELSEGARKLLENSVLPDLADRLDFKKFQDSAFEWLDEFPESLQDSENIFNEYPEEKDTWNHLVGDVMNRHGSHQVTLNQLLQDLDLRSKSPEPPQGAIPCNTIHASKGMEFRHVYLVGMVEDQLPSWAAVKKGDNSQEMQEERRNCFVAITRVQETLTLTYSDKVNGWSKEPSRFLFEMGLLKHGH